MPDFNALLDADPTSFETPADSYRKASTWSLLKGSEFGKSSQKQTPYVRFHYNVLQALDSVPQEALADMDLNKAKMRDDFYITEDAMFRLREFFELVDAVEVQHSRIGPSLHRQAGGSDDWSHSESA